MNCIIRIFKIMLRNAKNIWRKGKVKYCYLPFANKLRQRRGPISRNSNHAQERVSSLCPHHFRKDTPQERQSPAQVSQGTRCWAEGQDLSSNRGRFTSKTYFNYWHSLSVSGENLFWLGNRNKRGMDGNWQHCPLLAKLSTPSLESQTAERLVPATTIHTARLGQDGFWQKSDTFQEQLCCEAEGAMHFPELCVPQPDLALPSR